MNALAEQTKNQHTQVLGVNFDALQADALSKAADTMGIRFTVLAQDPGQRFKLPRSEALPVTYLVDPSGEVRERLMGEQTAAGLSKRLAELQAKE